MSSVRSQITGRVFAIANGGLDRGRLEMNWGVILHGLDLGLGSRAPAAPGFAVPHEVVCDTVHVREERTSVDSKEIQLPTHLRAGSTGNGERQVGEDRFC